jgi:hypothetical protein
MAARRDVLAAGLLALAAIGGVWLYRWWTWPPAVEFDNLKYIQLLSTAVSARNAEWLAKVEEAIEQRYASGEMSGAERQALQMVIQEARSGDWQQADRDCYRLAEAQLNRRRRKPPSAAHHD